jgi:hypothetical protein
MLAFFRHHEAEAAIEMVRGLDTAMLVSWFMPAARRDAEGNEFRRNMLFGARATLGPLLSKLKGLRAVPWMASHSERASHVDRVLARSGEIVVLQRLVALERYGLATSTFKARNHIELFVSRDDAENEEREALRELLDSKQLRERDPEFEERHSEVTRRVERYVRIWRGHFIEYDNDWEVVRHYRREAEFQFAHAFAEYESLPDDALIGGAPFALWRKAATEAGARVLMHMQFAARLQDLNRSLNLRDLNTIFVSTSDAHRVLVESGLTEPQAHEFAAATTMTERMADEDEHEIPAPFYVALGDRYRLLPCFGTMLNPYTDLVRSLRRRHRTDWDRAVAGRETIFRNDLRQLFPSARFVVPTSGTTLRRRDGSVLTDIDAVVLDQQTGALALMQLKWFDIVGFSLRERHSRHMNLARANDWITKVNRWLEERDTAQLAADLRITLPANARPLVFVINRYGTHFTRGGTDGSSAAWMGWARLVKRMGQLQSEPDPIGRLYRECQHWTPSPALEPSRKRFELPELTVDLTVG